MSSWTSSAEAGGSPSRLFRTALFFLIVYCVASAAILAAGSAKAILLHRDGTYPEAPSVYAAIKAGRTGQIYDRLDAPPYTPLPYGPLFYFYNSILARLVHSDLLGAFLFGRLFAFATYLLCALLIFQIGRVLRVPGGQAALSVVLFLAMPVYRYNVSVRPDFPLLLLMLLSLYYAVRQESPGLLAYVPAGLLAGAAILVKPSGIAVLLAIAAVLLSRRKYRQTGALVLSAVAPLGLALLFLAWRHEPFWAHLTILARSSWSFPGGVLWTLRLFRDPNLLIPVAIFCLGFPIAAVCEERTQMVVSFALVNFCVAMVSVGQRGGDINYFFPAAAGCAMLLPFATDLVAQSGERFQAVVCALMIVWLPMAFTHSAPARWDVLRAPLRQPALPLPALQKLHILSDTPYFDLLGSAPEFLDPLLAHSLELAGHGDALPMAQEIGDGKFDLVILAGSEPAIDVYRGIAFFGPQVVDALNRNYQRVCEAPGPDHPALVLQPRNRLAPVTPELMSKTLNRPCLPQSGRPPELFVPDFAR